jgi:hypothetical protein
MHHITRYLLNYPLTFLPDLSKKHFSFLVFPFFSPLLHFVWRVGGGFKYAAAQLVCGNALFAAVVLAYYKSPEHQQAARSILSYNILNLSQLVSFRDFFVNLSIGANHLNHYAHNIGRNVYDLVI